MVIYGYDFLIGCRQKSCLSGRNELILLNYNNLRFLVGLWKVCSLISNTLFLFLIDLVYIYRFGEGKDKGNFLIYYIYSLFI